MEAITKKLPKPDYRKEVEAMLLSYLWLLQMIEEENRLELPSCTPRPGDGIRGYDEYVSSTEKFGINRANKYYRTEVHRIEEAIKRLSYEERIVIRETYFYGKKKSVLVVCRRLGMNERKYYRIKRSAIEKLAYWMKFKK